MRSQSEEVALYLNQIKARENRKITFHREVKISFKGKAILINEDKKETDPNYKIELSNDYILNRNGHYRIIYTDIEKNTHITYFSIRKKVPIFVFILLFLPILLSCTFFQKNLDNNIIEQEISIAVSEQKDQEEEQIPNLLFHLYLKKGEESEKKSINLVETISKKELINNKIAPGIKGKFNIVLDTYNSMQDLEYEVKIKDKTQKPQNLYFKGKSEKEYTSLEELATTEFKGKILKDSKEIMTIQWEWKYEISDQNNQIDTKDSNQIAKYEFEVLASGKEI